MKITWHYRELKPWDPDLDSSIAQDPIPWSTQTMWKRGWCGVWDQEHTALSILSVIHVYFWILYRWATRVFLLAFTLVELKPTQRKYWSWSCLCIHSCISCFPILQLRSQTRHPSMIFTFHIRVSSKFRLRLQGFNSRSLETAKVAAISGCVGEE